MVESTSIYSDLSPKISLKLVLPLGDWALGISLTFLRVVFRSKLLLLGLPNSATWGLWFPEFFPPSFSQLFEALELERNKRCLARIALCIFRHLITQMFFKHKKHINAAENCGIFWEQKSENAPWRDVIYQLKLRGSLIVGYFRVRAEREDFSLGSPTLSLRSYFCSCNRVIPWPE